jgi:hypothetical protein
MLDEINSELKEYFVSWHALLADRADPAFFAILKPVALGWKVADKAEYDRIYRMLHDKCDTIVETWMNGRWIAKMHLKDTALEGGITLIKLMQRRPESTDLIGLDHVDFYTQAPDNGESVISQESNLTWTHESNDVLEDYHWLSIWFDDTEAKLKNATVLNNIIRELEITNQQILN